MITFNNQEISIFLKYKKTPQTHCYKKHPHSGGV